MGRALCLLTFAHLTLRLGMIVGRRGPINFADETGYLINARVLADGLPGALQEAAFYRGGYSLLLLPATWLGDTPVAEFRWALATNALLSALVVPLLYAVLRETFRIEHRLALVCAGVAGLYPPLVVTTQMAWTESVLPVLATALVFAVGRAADSTGKPLLWGAVSGGLAGFAYTVHGRGVVLAIALLAVLVGRRPRQRLATAGITGAVLAATVWAGGQLNDYLLRASYATKTSGGDIGRVLENAADPASAGSVLALGAGQFWYLVVASFAVVALGLVELFARLVSGLRNGRPSGATAAALFTLVSVLGLAVLVGLFLRPATRPDHVVYGRYIEIFAPLLLALGLARVAAKRLLGVTATVGAAFAVAGACVIIFSSFNNGLVNRSPVNWLTVLALPPLAQPASRIVPLTALAASVLGAAAALICLRRSRVLAAAVIATALLVSAVAVRVVLISARDHVTYGSASGALRAVPGVVTASTVGYDMAAYTPVGLYSYQWSLDQTRFLLFDSRAGQPPPARWVFAGTEWAEGRRLGAERVWVHDEVGQALWRLP